MNPLSHDAAAASRSPPKAPAYDLSSSQILSRNRPTSPSSSIGSLPYRRANTNISNLFASTSTLPGSNWSSGSNTPTAGGSGLAASVFSPGGSTANGTFSPDSQGRGGSAPTGKDEPRNLILRAYVPHVAVLTSPDVDEILAEKGFAKGGLLDLIRPFGEKIQGRVTIRNSVGSSTTWDDFGIRFVGLGDGLGVPGDLSRRSMEGSSANGRLSGNTPRGVSKIGGDVPVIEELVDRHLEWAEMMGPSSQGPVEHLNHKETDDDATPKTAAAASATSTASPFYTLYFRRLLSALPTTPHETFAHPVACCIVISSRNPNPIGELKELYHSTNTGDDKLPAWISNEYLRYYVLIHDEDRDDITKSTQLYEQMRRSFGLHCHLLRLRSTQCLPTDDDSVRLPTSEWSSAAEDLAEIQQREILDDEDTPDHFIPDSDTTALKTFIRELVAQSIVPSMERSTAHWNDQVAARRRGIGGRLMSLGKRFAFGGGASTRNSSSPVQGSAGGSGNYDPVNGWYRPEAPEAVMRRLGDYAFMLRDFKLAHSTYELVRSDFENDKAWGYWAGANEMASLSALMGQASVSRKVREESVDRMLEAAVHSYLNRSMTPFYALRTLLPAIELLKLRGGSAVDDAARWGSRIIETGLVGDIGSALVKERIVQCYASRRGVGSMAWGGRRRKAGLWTVMAAEEFLRMGKTIQAEKLLSEARRLYGLEDESTADALASFEGMREFLDQLRQAIMAARLQAKGYSEGDQGEGDLLGEDEKDEPDVEEVAEVMDTRPHRRSIVATTGLDPLGVMTEPLSPVRLRAENPLESTDEGFS